VCRAKDNDKFLALEKTFAFVSRTEEEEDLYGFNFVVLVFFFIIIIIGRQSLLNEEPPSGRPVSNPLQISTRKSLVPV
jgi:hypothetical protein